MTNVGEVFAFLQKKAPFELQEDFDNAGFLVGREQAPVSLQSWTSNPAEADQAYSPQPTTPLETVVAWRLL